jgi:hypothetical protein
MLGVVLLVVLAIGVIVGIGYIAYELNHRRQLRSVLSTWRTFDECVKAGLNEQYCQAKFPRLCGRGVVDVRLSLRTVAVPGSIADMRERYAAVFGLGYSHCLSDENFLHLFEQTMLSRDTLQYFEFCMPYPPIGPGRMTREFSVTLPTWWVARPGAV